MRESLRRRDLPSNLSSPSAENSVFQNKTGWDFVTYIASVARAVNELILQVCRASLSDVPPKPHRCLLFPEPDKSDGARGRHLVKAEVQTSQGSEKPHDSEPCEKKAPADDSKDQK